MASRQFEVLIAEDDAELRANLKELLLAKNFEVREATDGVEAVASARARRPDLAILDVNMPRLDGLEVLKRLKDFDPSIICIVLTAYSTIEDAVRAVKDGAYNYLAKPVRGQALVELVERALEAQRMAETMALSAPIVRLDNGDFVGNSREMRRVFQIVHKLAKVDTSVLIRGESGTGKELVARAIHFNSVRKDRRLVAINCTAIAETLFESELFGHEKGAFTGADQRQIGRFQYADGGTIFLDEIGDLSPQMQVKLLRVLQERRFTPVGSNREIELDVRIIAATNRNLEELITQGKFREDLFYRLNVIPVFLPPLRERKDDLGRLVEHFIAKFNGKHKKQIRGLSGSALAKIEEHRWPGNIRELENVIEHAFVIETGDLLLPSSLPPYLGGLANPFDVADSWEEEGEDGDDADLDIAVDGTDAIDGIDLDFQKEKERFERDFLVKALRTFHGRINQTALHAKIPKKTLLRKLTKYRIKAEDYRAT